MKQILTKTWKWQQISRKFKTSKKCQKSAVVDENLQETESFKKIEFFNFFEKEIKFDKIWK